MKILSAFLVSSSNSNGLNTIGVSSSSPSITSLLTMAATGNDGMDSDSDGGSPLLLPKNVFGKLFVTGATVGPVVDSLHNQCLLEYDRAPIHLFSSSSGGNLLETSWFIPPLLGIAYVVLGGILPRIFQYVLSGNDEANETNDSHRVERLKNKAILAVLSTAFIIKLSEYLQITSYWDENVDLGIMSVAAFLQWAVLDRTIPALLAATLTSIGGPLSELPFVANGFWHYIPSAANYYPLETILPNIQPSLALSSITGPCYFAVTMDAIALGRYFQSQEKQQ